MESQGGVAIHDAVDFLLIADEWWMGLLLIYAVPCGGGIGSGCGNLSIQTTEAVDGGSERDGSTISAFPHRLNTTHHSF